ncbi:MAG TPA: hypothetical protein VMG81_00165 [Thermoplasmata archaeon]|nr:hypothetical protein [Thermoplasmata archaeon]
MKQLVRSLIRPALWAVVILMLVATLASVSGAQAASSTYTLTGYAEQPGGSSPPPVPAGVQVDLESRATGTVYSTAVVGGGGQFTFTSANTAGTLAPGYWGVSVPAQANISVPSCKPCAILPQSVGPSFGYVNSSALTTALYPSYVTNVTVIPYTATLTGKVLEAGVPQVGAHLYLLDPTFGSLVLAQNNTTAGGAYVMTVPAGSWVLETELPGPTNAYNYTAVSLTKHQSLTLWTNVSSYLVSGYSNQASSPGAHVPTAGNVTLYDPLNGYIYSAPTPPGGYYAAGTYPANFTSGTQPFDVILSSIGYQSSWYALNVSSATPVTRNVLVPTVGWNELGQYLTTLNFSAFDPAVGNGTLSVSTIANLGNDTVFPDLANASVGQLWGQLALDYAHGTVFPASDLSEVYAWANSTGPFFPVAQAATAINGSLYVAPTSAERLTSFASTCTATCGLNSAANLTLDWSGTYALNQSVAYNSSSYAISFNFKHPTAAEVFNYTIDLPAGYVLAADTQAPAGTRLVAGGPDNTWTKFTLVSQPYSQPSGSAKFTIVKYATLTANVNVTVRNFAFSNANVLNQTHNNYTVIVGVGQNVTFSALNSTYPAGTNGTKFVWNFGDSSPIVTTTTATTYHIYTTATGATNYTGTLTVTSSGGETNDTTFYVWVAQGPVTAGLAVNATASQTRVIAGTTYYQVNWSSTLLFNSTPSRAQIAPGAPIPNVISVASYTVSGRGFKFTGSNFTASAGANVSTNYPFQFLGAGPYLSNGVVAGTAIPFLGWQYNVTLTVWDGTGQSASTTVVVLVNDTEKPTPAFQILGSNGKPITGAGVVEGSNFTALISLNGANATDPHNGSIVKYYWHITNSKNSSVQYNTNVTTVRPYPVFWLPPQSTPYTVNLTVWDRAGNSAYTNQTFSVSPNATARPILSSSNLNAPTTFTVGHSSTIWVNVTVGAAQGSSAVAKGLTVAFYLLSPSGTGSPNYIGGSPGSVQFYNYSGGVVSSTPFATGSIPSLAWNKTVRAEISWNPGTSGNYILYANASAQNEFAANYNSGPQTVSQSITVNPNPVTQLLEYVAIGAAVVIVIVLIVFWYRRRGRATTARPTRSKSGLERGSSSTAKSSSDDEDDDA